MKKLTCILIAVLAFSVCLALPIKSAVEAQDGRKNLEFDSKTFYDLFDYYTEIPGDTGVVIRDGAIYATGKSENKILLKNPNNLSSFTLQADFAPLDDICPFDAGFYLYANSPKDRLDGIVAYNVNLEKRVNENSIYVKIHRFSNGYLGEVAAVRVKIKKLPINLKVVAQEGNVKIYVFKEKVPVINCQLDGWMPGMVGIRTFRNSATKISNFSILASGIKTHTDDLDEALSKAKGYDLSLYEQTSAQNLQEAIQFAESISKEEQSLVDIATQNLVKAMDGLLVSINYQQLQEAITAAKSLSNEGQNKYTKNSLRSLISVIERAEKLSAEDSAYDISYMDKLLKDTVNRLIKYA